jgi:hypothetical protein
MSPAGFIYLTFTILSAERNDSVTNMRLDLCKLCPVVDAAARFRHVPSHPDSTSRDRRNIRNQTDG